MKEQFKYFLKIKAALIGTGGAIHLLAHSFAVKLLATNLLFAKAAILAFVGSLGPVVWAQNVVLPSFQDAAEISATVEKNTHTSIADQIKSENIAQYEEVKDTAQPDTQETDLFAGYPSYEEYQARLAATKEEKETREPNQAGNTAVGKTSLGGAPMSEAEYYEYIAALKRSEAEKEAERREHQTAVGKTTLAGIAE